MFDNTQIGFMTAVAVLVLVPGPNTMLILAHSWPADARGPGHGPRRRDGNAGPHPRRRLRAVRHPGDLGPGLRCREVRGRRLPRLPGCAGAPARRGLQPVSTSSGVDLSRAFWRAVLTNVLNPKVALFFVALLPQFVRPERGHAFLQSVALGLIVVVMGLSFSSVLAVAAGSQ